MIRRLQGTFLTGRFRKYGKKALVVYLCWCAAKGILFLFIGSKLFG